MKRDVFIISALGLVFITLPLFFERLHSDEVIFWEVARNIAEGRGMASETAGGAFYIHPPLPFLINSLFLRLLPHIFTARAVSSLFTTGSAVFVYLVGREKTGRAGAFIGSCLFIFSFQTLRFGGRFYLDQYGAFFFLVSLYLNLKGRALAAGTAILLASLSREYWVLAYPFILLNTSGGTRERLKSASPLLALAASLAAFFLLSKGGGGGGGAMAGFLSDGALIKNLSATMDALLSGRYLLSVLRAFSEFSALNALTAAGFIAWAVTNETGFSRRYLAVIAPLLLALALTNGFVIDGGVTQYPLSLAAALAPFAGEGLHTLWKRLISRGRPSPHARGFMTATLVALSLQFAFLNAFSTSISLHKNIGVYAMGYWDDEKVIEMLRERAGGQFIHGLHGAFVEDRKRWDWTDYRMGEAIQKDPDWLITFDNYVEVLPEDAWKGKAEVLRVGPYIIAHSLRKGAIRLTLKPRDFDKWRLKKG